MATTATTKRRATRRRLATTLALLAGLAALLVPPAAAGPDATADSSPAVAAPAADEIRSGATLNPWVRSSGGGDDELQRVTTSRSLPLALVRDLVVDDVHGHVYISGDDRIVVTDLAGTIQQLLDVPGARGMVVVGDTLYVAQFTPGIIGRAHIGATLTMLPPLTSPAGALEQPRSLAYAGGALWTTTGSCDGLRTEAVRVDLGNGSLTLHGEQIGPYRCPILEASGTTLVIAETQSSGTLLRHVDVGDAIPVVTGELPATGGSILRDLALDEASGVVLTATASPYYGQTWQLPSFTPSSTYLTGPYPSAIASTRAAGGLVAVGRMGPQSLQLFRTDAAETPIWAVNLDELIIAGTLAFSGDGQRLYAVSGYWPFDGTHHPVLRVVDVDDPTVLPTTTTTPPTTTAPPTTTRPPTTTAPPTTTPGSSVPPTTTPSTTAPPTTTTPPSSNFGEFHAVDPARVHDSRTGARVQRAAVTVTGRGGVPASGVSAVAVNVTVTDSAAPGFLTVYPANVPQPNASTVNYRPGRTVPNMAVIGVSGGGQLGLYASSPAHVIVDVVGWFGDSSAPNGSRFHPVLPKRWFDTRSDARGDGRVRPVGPGDSVITSFTGGRPAADSHVGAMALNVTATNTTSESYLTVTPFGAPLGSSNLNWRAGDVVPNAVITKIDAAAGVARFTNAFGATDVIADVFGFWDDGTPGFGARFVPTQPVRLVDTRIGLTPPRSIDATAFRLPPYTAVTFDALSYSHPLASAVALNITAVDPSQPGYLTVFPLTDDRTHGLETSTLNFGPGDVRANLSLMPLGASGQVVLANMSEGTVDVLVDLTGFFL